MNILLIYPSYSNFQENVITSITTYYGLEAALKELGHVVYSVPVPTAHAMLCNEEYIDKFLDMYQKTYDILICDPMHLNLHRSLKDLAPIRIAYMLETSWAAPTHWKSIDVLKNTLTDYTHCLTLDEGDVGIYSTVIDTRICFPSFPSCFHKLFPISKEPSDKIAFFGRIYDDRERILQTIPEIEIPRRLELEGDLPRLYQEAYTSDIVTFDKVARETSFASAAIYLNTMQKYKAVVAMESRTKTHTPVIIEAMSMEVPIIIPILNDRPITNSRFKDREEVLMYHDIDSLKQCISEIGIANGVEAAKRNSTENYFKEYLNDITIS